MTADPKKLEEQLRRLLPLLHSSYIEYIAASLREAKLHLANDTELSHGAGAHGGTFASTRGSSYGGGDSGSCGGVWGGGAPADGDSSSWHGGISARPGGGGTAPGTSTVASGGNGESSGDRVVTGCGGISSSPVEGAGIAVGGCGGTPDLSQLRFPIDAATIEKIFGSRLEPKLYSRAEILKAQPVAPTPRVIGRAEIEARPVPETDEDIHWQEPAAPTLVERLAEIVAASGVSEERADDAGRLARCLRDLIREQTAAPKLATGADLRSPEAQLAAVLAICAKADSGEHSNDYALYLIRSLLKPG